MEPQLPAFPPVEIDGELFWDGSVVSNTPLEQVVDAAPRRSTLCFIIDLFDTAGEAPGDLDDVLERHKDITYTSRSEGQTSTGDLGVTIEEIVSDAVDAHRSYIRE